MNARQKMPKPTEAEVEVLKVLWERGPNTVRQVNEQINAVRKTGYTTTLKIMQRMTEKGLITPDQSQRSYVYSPNLSLEEAQEQMVQDVLNNVMGGSARRLIMRALDTQPMSAAELDEIEKTIRKLKGGR